MRCPIGQYANANLYYDDVRDYLFYYNDDLGQEYA
jgi:hypothetical protein